MTMTDNPEITIGKDEINLVSLILEKQQAFYIEILSLCKEESKKFHALRPMSEIFPLVRKRKILFSCAEEFEEKLKPIEPILNQIGEKNSGIKKALKEIEETLKEILSLDHDNQEKMKTHLQKLKAKQLQLMKEEQK